MKILNEQFPWTKKTIEKLIYLYQQHENLYNPHHKDYIDRGKRYDSCCNILEELKKDNSRVTIQLIKAKLKNLRTQYVQDLKKVEHSKKSGSGVDDIYVPKVWYYEKFHFLQYHINTRISTSSLDDMEKESTDDAEEIGSQNIAKPLSEQGSSLRKRKNKMKKWTDANIILLIKMYEQYPDLWRCNVKSKNPELRMNLWAHIAEVEETTSDEVRKKIKSLRTKFGIEVKRYEENPSDYFQNNPWKFFRQFMFLLRENEFKGSSAVSESFMSESNCSSKQFDTEDSSAAPSRHQDESRDFESFINFEENEGDEEYDGPEFKKKRLNGQEKALEDALQCIKTLLDESDKRDEHSIYGEHIAHKLRTSNRSNSDIAIAQHHIENIVFNLTMGLYAQEVADASEDKSNLVIPPIIASSVPDPFIIPKPDPSP